MLNIDTDRSERIDDTGFGDIRVIQRPGFGYGVDSVLLAAFAAGETGARGIGDGSRIADLGSGCGIVAFILAHKTAGTSVVGYDIQEDAVDRASRACDANGMNERVAFRCEDICSIDAGHDYDAVVTNPPYFRRESSYADRTDERYVSRHETTADLGDFVRTASGMLTRGGSLYMVHRPSRLADIVSEMRACRIEPKTLQLVVPCAGQAANIVLIHGISGAGSGMTMLPDIAVHTPDRGYTDTIRRIYER